MVAGFKRTRLLLFLLCGSTLLWAAREAPVWEAGISEAAAQATASKLRQVQEGHDLGLSYGRINISEQEANSYFHYEMAASLPPGVSKVRLQFQPRHPIGYALVDFDVVMETLKNPPNPLISYFLRGIHTVGVEGTFSSANRIGQFELETVTLDGVTLPQFVVDFLIERYVKARYPGVAIDRPFSLPFSLEEVSVQAGRVVLLSRSDDL